jgi:hypothetical protein
LSKGRALLWRMTRQIVASLFAAIHSQPNLKTLRENIAALKYRLREPPRRRKLQTMEPLC